MTDERDTSAYPSEEPAWVARMTALGLEPVVYDGGWYGWRSALTPELDILVSAEDAEDPRRPADGELWSVGVLRTADAEPLHESECDDDALPDTLAALRARTWEVRP